MKVGLLGYGKMGKTIATLAIAGGDEVAWAVDRENRASLNDEMLQMADVVIEFSRPEAAFGNVRACVEAGVPVVSGTTGWADQLAEAGEYCRAHGGAFLWASNFSVGVNLFFALNTVLTKMMNERPEYEPAIEEIHHIHKIDAPSGTALTLVTQLIQHLDRKNRWALMPAAAEPDVIPVTAERTGEVPGTHIVRWESPVDEITIAHKAHSRTGFASGALLAARWLIGKKGVFTMHDVLGL